MKKVRAPMRPAVALSPDDARELRALSADLERELMRTYEDFVARSRRVVDERRWKHVKSQEEVHIYRERGSYKQAMDPVHTSADQHDLELEIGPQAALAANSKMPMLMGTGTLPGQVNEAIYGSSFFDTRSLRARNSYSREANEENAVLAIVDGPTQEDPFQFLGIVWYYKVFPIPGILASRDMLLLASSHLTQLSTGERVAVMLHHSIEHRDAPQRRDLNILRAEVSIATIYRQIDELRYEVFISSFVDPKGSTAEALIHLDSARSLLIVTYACDVALRRKLFYRMRDTQKSQRERAASAAMVSRDDGGARRDDDSHCALCNKKISGIFSSGSTCQICTKHVCGKCSVTKDIVIESHRTAYTAVPFDFCLVCTLETKEIPALTVARDELQERLLAPRNPLSSSASSSSTGSI